LRRFKRRKKERKGSKKAEIKEVKGILEEENEIEEEIHKEEL